MMEHKEDVEKLKVMIKDEESKLIKAQDSFKEDS